MIRRRELITTIIVIIVGLLLIVGVFAFTKPIYDKKIKEEKLKNIKLSYPQATDFTEFPLNSSYENVLFIAHVYNGNAAIGYFYQVVGKNNFGNLDFLISVGLNERITNIEPLEVNQTESYLTRVTQAINHYTGEKITDVIDADVGQTNSVSINTINAMLREVKEAHSNVEKLSTWKHNIFDNYEVQLTEEDITSNILIKETIVDGQGYVYRVQDEGINQEGSTTIKKIQMEVAVDQSGILLGYDFVLYEHSGGGFRDDTVKYLDSLIGTNLNDLVDTIAGPTPDGVTAMYSRILVHNILVHIKEDLS